MNNLIRLKSVEIENFLSIKSASYDFQNRGLVGVFGQTGVGKSSLFVESLVMGTFGLSERYGKSRDLVVNRFIGQDCYIGLNYDVDGNDVCIKTYRKHTKYKNEVFFTVNGEDRRGNSHDQTRENICRYLDMDYLAFTNSIVFGQGVAKYFSSMSDADQKMIAERLLGITWIPRAYELVGVDIDSMLSGFNKHEFAQKNLSTKILVLEGELKNLKLQSDNFGLDIQNQIKQVENEMSDVYCSLRDDEPVRLKIEEIKRKLNTFISIKAFDLIEGMGKLKTDLAIIESRISTKRELLNELNARLNVKSKSNESVCPYCNQNISPEYWGEYLKHLNSDMASIKKDILGYEAEKKKIELSKQEYDLKMAEVTKLQTEKMELENTLSQLEKDLAVIDKQNELIKERILGLGEKIDELQARVNPFGKLIEETTDKIVLLHEELEQIEILIDKLKEDMRYLKFWQEGFSNKGLKSYIIESVIPSMNESAKLYSKLLVDKYDIMFSPTRSLKKGDVREKFNIEVNNRYGSELYEGNSNGERRTIDIIIMFVLGDLAAKRCNKRFSILVLDDVFEKIDESICENVMSVLRMLTLDPSLREEEFRQLPQRESIFVLTHLDYFKQKFENQMIVENSNGQTIYREN